MAEIATLLTTSTASRRGYTTRSYQPCSPTHPPKHPPIYLSALLSAKSVLTCHSCYPASYETCTGAQPSPYLTYHSCFQAPANSVLPTTLGTQHLMRPAREHSQVVTLPTTLATKHQLRPAREHFFSLSSWPVPNQAEEDKLDLGTKICSTTTYP